MTAENKHLQHTALCFIYPKTGRKAASSHEAPVIRIRWIEKEYAGFSKNLNLNLERLRIF